MLIACLGWGSLVWDPRGLPIRGPCALDGPLQPIEFARQSNDGRLTLVLVRDRPAIPLVRGLWAVSSVSDLDGARQALAHRERVPRERVNVDIGAWNGGAATGIEARIAAWARSKDIEAVVWTNLPPKFGNEVGRIPSADEAVHYLQGQTHEKRRLAEHYAMSAWCRVRWTRSTGDDSSESSAGRP